ncbi:MAG: hypothetical protein MUE44_33510 [Oscillatoriaceae cyanobacterium Prado104]|nr:hypothetical protein [Oscillatoriaceae cyanobacterium Prado104]
MSHNYTTHKAVLTLDREDLKLETSLIPTHRGMRAVETQIETRSIVSQHAIARN